MSEKIQGIYEIRNTINGKRYIGSSVNIKSRWRSHKTAILAKTSECTKLQRAWNKYGGQSFVFNIVEIVNGDKEELYKREQYYIDFYDTVRHGYNILASAGSCAGCKLSDKTRTRMSESHKRENLSDETRIRMSESHKRENLSEETLRKMSISATGRRHTDEAKAKISEANRGEKHPFYGLAKEDNPNYGKVLSAETRAKIASAHKGKKLSPESIAKRTATRRIRDEERKRLAKTTT